MVAKRNCKDCIYPVRIEMKKGKKVWCEEFKGFMEGVIDCPKHISGDVARKAADYME